MVGACIPLPIEDPPLFTMVFIQTLDASHRAILHSLPDLQNNLQETHPCVRVSREGSCAAMPCLLGFPNTDNDRTLSFIFSVTGTINISGFF